MNLCRVLAYLKGGECAGEEPAASAASPEPLILSKKGGGEWGLRFLPRGFRGLIETALVCYRDGTDMTVQAEEGECFAEYMLTEIRKNLETEPLETEP